MMMIRSTASKGVCNSHSGVKKVINVFLTYENYKALSWFVFYNWIVEELK